ncbi:MAG: TonB-dependent receptor [candidate division Zixibacteria bacterium]|nr:TonB-dependent receptor [candidate division Zixibacteria bacterium]
MRSKLLLLLMLGVLTSPVAAETISGQVTNSDGDPLARVSVSTNVPSVGTITDSEGAFELAVEPMIEHVTFSSVGYQSRQFKAGEVPATVVLERKYYRQDSIIVTADRATVGITPIAFENLTEEEIDRDYTVGEFPLLLKMTPNLYTYSEAGSSLGYSSIRIRGFDDKRIATYINGVPLNDPEDHATYFFDLPDLAANITDVQVQRGVGNSLYGDASFGGAINIVTTGFNRERKVTMTAGYGEYTSGGKSVSDIYKQSLEYSSGLVDGRWLFGGRFSKQKTGGYRHNSWYRGWSYYFSVARLDPRMTTELHFYGGPVRAHLAYYGAGRETLEEDRRANFGIAGWDDLTYNNYTDNFNQPHYQLHNRYEISDAITLTNTLYYIRGNGYYEQLKLWREYAEYNIDASVTGGVEYGDIVLQKWVGKSQYGWNPRLDIEHERGTHSLGGSFYLFNSEHWGQVVWAEQVTSAIVPQHTYYRHAADKQVASFFAQEYYRLTDRLAAQLTAQIRYDRYSLDQDKIGQFVGHSFDVDWLFFSPRIGLTYQLNHQASLYANAAVASRTPTDDDIYDANDPGKFPSLEVLDSMGTSANTIYKFGDPVADPERVYDFELGGHFQKERCSFGVNLFFMDFQNEIVQYAGNHEGREATININGSYHSGIELAGAVKPMDEFTISGNFSYNRNRIKDYPDTIEVDVDSEPTITEMWVVNYKNRKLPNFPEYLGNVTADFQHDWLRLTWHGQLIGRQYADLWNSQELSIDPTFVASLSISATVVEFLDLGRLTFSGRVDNMFDKKYEAIASYAENWATRDVGQSQPTMEGWAAYFVAPERSFYAQVKLEMF